MRQHDTLVARAIVQHEIGLLGSGVAFASLPRLTTQRIVDKYGLAWGNFALYYDDGLIVNGWGADRARQLIRNELNRAFRAQQLIKLRWYPSGKKVREGTNVVFTAEELWIDDLSSDLAVTDAIYG